MPFCYQCGCQVDPGVTPCPACGVQVVPPPGVAAPASIQARYPELTRPDELPARRKVWLMWRMVTVITTIALGVMGASDALAEPGMSWSLFAMPAVFSAWWVFSTLLWFPRQAGLLVALQAPVIVGCLALLDLARSGFDWFLPLGLPVTGMVSVYALALWGTRRGLGCRWAVVAWGGLMLLAPVSVGLELLIDGYRGEVRLRWSLVVVAVLLPLSAFLVYLNIYLQRYRIDLWRYLHSD